MVLLHKKVKLIMIALFIAFGLANSQQHVQGQFNSEKNAEIKQLIQQESALKGAIIGVSIRSATTGEIIFQHNGDIRLKPASNLKLLTAAAALEVLGENYRFTTNLYSDGTINKGILKGDLIVQGKGDPTLLKADFDKFADTVKKAGIREVDGNLLGDDSWYDHVRYSLDMPWSDEETYYGAQISALTASPDEDYDAGTIKVEVRPGKTIGASAHVTLTPKTNYVKIVNDIVTVSHDGPHKLSYKREHGTNTVIISGTIPIKSKAKREWIGVWEPTLYALDLFKQALSAKGIQVNGSTKYGIAPESARLLYSHESIPLSKLMMPFMKLSNNGHAEILIKEMGKIKKGEGSWEKGLEVMEETLRNMGMNTDTILLRDGSGISHANLVPANELTKLLFIIQKERWFPVLVKSLPVSGDATKEIGGTLRRRMKDPNLAGRITAKTGTIATVSTLSGYVELNNGERIIFAILLNNLMDESIGKQIEDRFISVLAN